MFWRFLVYDDPSVARFVVRDADSRLNLREAAAVAQWVASGTAFHSMRDHPNQNRPFNGGMWGALGPRRRRADPRAAAAGPGEAAGVSAGGEAAWSLEELVRQWEGKELYAGDLDFLSQKVRRCRSPAAALTARRRGTR